MVFGCCAGVWLKMWYDPITDTSGWTDSLDYEGEGVSCYIVEYGYFSDPYNPDSNGNGIDDYR